MNDKKEFLISELLRFVDENGRNPVQTDMQGKFGYPTAWFYRAYFGTWNKALIVADLEINECHFKLDNIEICSHCGKRSDEIITFTQWYYNKNKNIRYCNQCGNAKGLYNYKNGNLDKNSATGKAFISQRVVAKVLGLDLKYDCNCSQGFNSKYDLYDKDGYGYINVKYSILHNTSQQNPHWIFNLVQKEIPDTYIMLGFSSDKSDILHVWITDPLDDLTFEKTKISITAAYLSGKRSGLKRAASWEVDVKPYNDAYHSMSLENCRVLKSD